MTSSAAELIPPGRGVKALREAATGCRACPLWRNATQTVFGAGAARAPVMLVGEQPGDREDAEGLPFVGPAGHLEVEACRPWLDAEIERVKPDVVGILGATAAKALLGTGFRVSRERGELIEADFAPVAVATYHPSAVLRAQDEDRREAFADLVADLRVLADAAD